MEKKIRLITVEKNNEGVALFNKRMEPSAAVQLVHTYTYHSEIADKISPDAIDIIAVDINLPCNIAAFVKELKVKIAPVKILMTCDFVQPDLVVSCLLAGADGYVEKYAALNKFEQAIKDCHENLSMLPLNIIALLYAKIILQEADATRKKIFRLFSNGFLLNEVMLQTGLSEREIKQHIFLSLRH